MNIKLETRRLRDLEENIELLENTNTLHPFAMAETIHYNKHKAKAVEDKILNYLML